MPAGETAPESESPPALCAAAARPRIFILSDVRLFREGLAWCLASRSDIEVIAALAPSADALSEIARSDAAVVLLDVAMPGAFGLPKELGRLAPGIKIIAFAVNEIDHELMTCAEAGVAGYVTRDGSVDDLVASVQSALRGEVVCSPRIAALLFRRVAALSEETRGVQDHPKLTRREREIARLVDEGLSNKEIAQALNIGSATVKNHVHNILEKLKVRRRSEAAARLRGLAPTRYETRPSAARGTGSEDAGTDRR